MTQQQYDGLKVRGCSVQSKTNPEWGTFGVMERRAEGDLQGLEIFRSKTGWIWVAKSEALQFWEIVGQS